MPTTPETAPAIDASDSGELVCDHLLKSIGDRLDQMTRHQYDIYGELLSEMSAVMTGRDIGPEGRDEAWNDLRKRARGLLLAIEANGPGADTRPYSSFDESGLSEDEEARSSRERAA